MKTTMVAGCIALIAAVSVPLTVHANMLTNGGLEPAAGQLAPVSSDGLVHASSTTNASALTGWTLGGACIDIVPNTYWGNTEGTYSVDMAGSTGIGSITQTVSGLTPGNLYELSFDFSVNPSGGVHGGESAFTKWIDVGITNSDQPDSYFSGTVGTRTTTNMQYVTRGIVFTADSTSTTITIAELFPTGLPSVFSDGTSVLPNTISAGVVLDNVDLQPLVVSGGSVNGTVVPEPASLGLLGIGALMLMRRRR
ncbi:MAG TPA: DUF642 domain-containing protein [Phycisphaerae bacterium]|nr:DUF642 domain-containing protein [Phycisphaerae bacterium]